VSYLPYRSTRQSRPPSIEAIVSFAINSIGSIAVLVLITACLVAAESYFTDGAMSVSRELGSSISDALVR
jgi:hypothetical protein